MMEFYRNYSNLIEAIIIIVIAIPTLLALLRGAPFVPTPHARVKKMLALAKIKKGEKVYDIGCGDGRSVYWAAKIFGANAEGIELSPLVYLWARIRKFFWRSKAKITFANLWWKNFSDADVIVFYLMPNLMPRLAAKFKKELKPGTRIVSYAFQVKDLELLHRERRVRKRGFAPIWVYEI
ncbi:class I SAM-dependent methyltransferase [Patescibacteria group bacterium]|nr:class I SAM-dependent methyltransferase [Patescibacteria group bacterium]